MTRGLFPLLLLASFSLCQQETSLTRTNVIGGGSSFASNVYQSLSFYYR